MKVSHQPNYVKKAKLELLIANIALLVQEGTTIKSRVKQNQA